jgi:hypothetical protein
MVRIDCNISVHDSQNHAQQNRHRVLGLQHDILILLFSYNYNHIFSLNLFIVYTFDISLNSFNGDKVVFRSTTPHNNKK